MGTWGVEPFANDDAADFGNELDDLDPQGRVEAIREALTAAADETDYLQADTASVAVAAAALVANQYADDDLLDSVYGPEQEIPPLPEDLRPLATRALDRVLAADSELRELWGDSDDTQGWVDEITKLQEVLVLGS